ncbi:MAG: prepilin-type N-terminal cleavage/methylation domain-containing protein [Fuerstiella sp.]|nr:prepilin-type N-terminal cleavage/methylation domain-containing protein [Fuerstiella sp.]
MNRVTRLSPVATPRSGFTLLELLIVVSIISIVLTVTLLAVNLNNEAERVRNGARQVQSFLRGAKDRAIKTGQEVGVRFFFGQPPSSADATTTQIIARQVTGMAYIGRSGTWPPVERAGEAERIELVDNNSDGDTDDPGEASLISSRTDWWSLKRRGWLVTGMRVRIPDSSTGTWYQIDATSIDTSAAPPAESVLWLITPYRQPAGQVSYSIELPWSMLPEAPSILPEDVVIDLDASRVPDFWRPTLATDLYKSFVDVVFSPRGNVTGDAAFGLLHFYVCDAEDSLFLKEQFASANGFATLNTNVAAGQEFVPMDELNATTSPWAGAYNVKPRRLVTVIPQTGAVSVHEVYAYIDPEVDPDPGDIWPDNDSSGGPSPGDGDGIADDPFRFAETGEASN